MNLVDRIDQLANSKQVETAKRVLYPTVLAAFWALTLVMWVYMANYIYWFLTGRMELGVLALKGITPVVNLAIAVYWSGQYRNYLRRMRTRSSP